MIALLNGKIAATALDSVVVDVHGVGFLVFCPTQVALAAKIEHEVVLHVSTQVKEDSISLYGFTDQADRDFFELAQTASGIGPKVAMAILNTLPAEEFATAVVNEDVTTLCKVPGIGKKGAQKLILELKDKVCALGLIKVTNSDGVKTQSDWRWQVMEGLQGLGWSEKEANSACDQIVSLADREPTPGLGVLMKAALASLDRGRA